MYSPEVNARLNELRAKAAANTILPEELAEGVRLLRQGRRAAVESAARKRSRAVREVRSAEDMLAELENLG